MKGKRTNILIGISELFCAILLLIYVWQTKTNLEMTRHQKLIFDISKYFCIISMSFSVFLNLILAAVNIRRGHISVYYVLTCIALVTFFHHSYIYPAILMLLLLCIITIASKNNYIEKESFALSTYSVIISIIYIAMAIVLLNNQVIAAYIKKLESVNLKAYSSEYFKYVEPLQQDVYINVEQDGKWGYIDRGANILIDFKYDYASPFYEIEKFDKKFKVAAVSNGNITSVILKNEREVMTYNSEYSKEDVQARLDEFLNILKTQMDVKDPILEVDNRYYGLISKNRIYNETYKEGMTKRLYEFSPKYDVEITISEINENKVYKLVEKETEKTKKIKNYIKEEITLDVENLIYDDDHIYLYKNGELPFISPNKKEQGWYEQDGKINKIEGKAQILSLEKDRIALKNYGINLAYFVSRGERNTFKKISPAFKEIIPVKDAYIVKLQSDKWIILDKNLNPIMPKEAEIFKGSLLSQGLYIFANPANYDMDEYGYPEIAYTIMDENFNVIGTNITHIFNFNIKNISAYDSEEYQRYIEKLKSKSFETIIDKYYK